MQRAFELYNFYAISIFLRLLLFKNDRAIRAPTWPKPPNCERGQKIGSVHTDEGSKIAALVPAECGLGVVEMLRGWIRRAVIKTR